MWKFDGRRPTKARAGNISFAGLIRKEAFLVGKSLFQIKNVTWFVKYCRAQQMHFPGASNA